MYRSEIIEELKKMKTASDLAYVLNLIKQEEFGSVRYNISGKMLKYYSSDSIEPKRFRTFHIRKKRGGLREIKAPCRQLDVILKCVNILLKTIYEPSDVAMGFTSGRSVLDNAQVHVGHNYVFNIDLKDFFPSIPQARVWKRLQLAPFNFSQEVANILAGLCCSYDKTVNANVLPQGSPASPLLTNAICDKLDRRMKGVAKRFGLHYSRYADDMTFSSMHNVYHEGGEFRMEIQRIIAGQGFRINENKTRLQKTGTRQEVTGLTVNAIANVSRKYISDLRWILHIWEKEGYAKAYALFYRKYKHDKGYIKRGEPIMENVIGGKIDYLRMVRGASNPAYQKLAARYAALQKILFVEKETDDLKSYVYVQPYTIDDFQSLFQTTISLEISKNKKVVGKCTIDNRVKFLAISASTQKILCPDLEEKSAGDSVQSKDLDKCFVTLCRNKWKNFWLITKFEPKRSLCLSIQNLKVSPDELLTLWEKKGFEYAADELVLFIQFGKPGESILDWGSQFDSDEVSSIDRGSVYSGEECLLGYFLKNRNLTVSQRKRFAKLLTSIITETPTLINVDKESGVLDSEVLLYHSPKRMIEFLSLFSRDDRFKWYTHKWDMSTPFDIDELINRQMVDKTVLNIMTYPKESGPVVNELTYNQVWNFINFKNYGQNKYRWKNTRFEDIKYGWHSIVDLSKKRPDVPIEDLNINNEHQFKDFVRMFKAVIEFRTDLRDDDRFSELIWNAITSGLPKDFDLTFSSNFDEVGYDINVYCDVVGVLSALNIICNWIVRHKTISSTVSVDLISEGGYYILEIFHVGSYFNNIGKLRNPTGDFDILRRRLFSVCDFFMQGDFMNDGQIQGSIIVNALDENTKIINKVLTDCDIDKSNNEVGGVIYKLKIYKR